MSLDAGSSRPGRQGCGYETYVPDPLTGLRFRLDGHVAAEVLTPSGRSPS